MGGKQLLTSGIEIVILQHLELLAVTSYYEVRSATGFGFRSTRKKEPESSNVGPDNRTGSDQTGNNPSFVLPFAALAVATMSVACIVVRNWFPARSGGRPRVGVDD